MMRFKSCPKCGGDMLVDKDQYGWYEQCMQCGFLGDLKELVKNDDEAVRRVRAKKKAVKQNIRAC